MFVVGMSLVVISWTAAVLGSISLVGQLFFVGSLTSLSFSLFAGYLADRINRLAILLTGLVLRLLAIAAFGLHLVYSSTDPVVVLYFYTIVFSLGSLLASGAVDGIIQRAVAEDRRVRLAIRASFWRQIGILTGAASGGFVLHHFSASSAVLVLAGVSVIQLLIAGRMFSGYGTALVKAPASIIEAWTQGFRSIGLSRPLMLSIAGVGLFFSISQMANVLVPGFVHETLRAGSDVYGLLEAAWAVGGGVVLACAVGKAKFLEVRRAELILLVLIGIAMVVFASLRSIPVLVIIYAALGGMFALGRALCDGRILVLALNAEIGRVRAITTILVSSIGMTIYITPTVIGINDAVPYYIFWGIFVFSIGLILLIKSSLSDGLKNQK